MRKLKTKFKKKKRKLEKIIVKKKLGRWCEYYSGRLPYPIECQWNAQIPAVIDRPNCRKCKRSVHFQAWKYGIWEKIKYAIAQGEDLTNMNPPNQEIK